MCCWLFKLSLNSCDVDFCNYSDGRMGRVVSGRNCIFMYDRFIEIETNRDGAGWQKHFRVLRKLHEEIFFVTDHKPHQWGPGGLRGSGWPGWQSSPSWGARRGGRLRGCKPDSHPDQSVLPKPGQSSSPPALQPCASPQEIQMQGGWKRHPVSHSHQLLLS